MTTYLIGDLHGHYRDYQRLLVDCGLCDDNLAWTGGEARLWLMGDFFDRGASGIKCVDITMRLQQEAARAGGMVNSLLGNHEMMILCAWKFRDAMTSMKETVMDQWLRWGGIESDLTALTEEHVSWLQDLPAMALEGNNLLVHADAMLYVDFGTDVNSVNERFREVTHCDDLDLWESALSAFTEHMAFASLEITGIRRADQLLALYGGKRLIHGHTPIPFARQVEAETVTEAWEYAGGRCLNVDGGMYMGSPGFVHQL